MQNLPNITRLAQIYWEHAAKRGKQPHIALMLWAWVAENRAKAIEEYEKGVMRTVRDYWAMGGFHIEGHEEFDPWVSKAKSEEEVTLKNVQDRMILGSPQECIEQIEQWRETTGAEYFVLRFRHAEGPSHQQTVKSLQLFGEKVIPHFR